MIPDTSGQGSMNRKQPWCMSIAGKENSMQLSMQICLSLQCEKRNLGLSPHRKPFSWTEWDAGSHDWHRIRENFAPSFFFVRLNPSQFYNKLFTLTLKVGRISPSESNVFSRYHLQGACLYWDRDVVQNSSLLIILTLQRHFMPLSNVSGFGEATRGLQRESQVSYAALDRSNRCGCALELANWFRDSREIMKINEHEEALGWLSVMQSRMRSLSVGFRWCWTKTKVNKAV